MNRSTQEQILINAISKCISLLKTSMHATRQYLSTFFYLMDNDLNLQQSQARKKVSSSKTQCYEHGSENSLLISEYTTCGEKDQVTMRQTLQNFEYTFFLITKI